MELFDQIGFGNPPQLANFKKGTTKRVLQELSPMCMYQKDAHLLAVGWYMYDKRPVCLLSSVDDDHVSVKRIRSKDGSDGYNEIRKPDAIDHYNTYMGGVDKSDQMNLYYCTP